MNEIKTLSNQALITKTENLVCEERRITTEVLQCLREVEARMLYAELGYSSLHEFCIVHLHYSEGSTHRRIAAMRLLKNLPSEMSNSAQAKIQNGALTLSNLSTLQGFFRTEKRESGKVYSAAEKAELIQSMEHQSKREVERKLAAIQPKILPKESERALNGELTEIKFIADAKFMENLKRMREITAHKIMRAEQSSDLVQLFQLMMEEYLTRHDPMEKAKRASTSPATKPCVKAGGALMQ